MIALLVMTDGRVDCISQTIASAEANLSGPITRRIIHDDSGNADYQEWLTKQFPTYDLIGSHVRRGFGGAIRSAWEYLVENEDSQPERYVFHLEDDFAFDRPVDLSDLIDVLDANNHLVQLALRRQPWNDEERAAGGIVESHPGDYTQCFGPGGAAWLEHRRFYTTNPSLYRRSLCRQGWPEREQSEGHFTQHLLGDSRLRFGFWGARDSGEWVTHIGSERAGVGY